MGWLFSESWPTASSMRDHLRDELKSSGYEIVKDALVSYGRRYYAAIKFTGRADTKPEDDRLGKTFIFVALLTKHGGDFSGWGYKDMDESMGPCEIDCPLSILDAADPVEALYGPVKDSGAAKWASDWRASVRAHWAKQVGGRARAKTLKVGDKVHAGGAHSPYTVARVGKTLAGYGTDGVLYRIPKVRIERVEELS